MNNGLLGWPRGGRGAASLLGWPVAPTLVVPSVVQTAQANNANATSLTLTPSLALTRGNLLLTLISYSLYPGVARTVPTVTGWSKLADLTTGNSGLAIFQKLVLDPVTDAAATTWAITGSSENCSGVFVEIADADPATVITTLVASGTATSRESRRNRSLALIAWKRETAAGVSVPSDVTQITNTGTSGYHQIILGRLTNPLASGDTVSAALATAALSSVLVVPPRASWL